MLCSGCIPATGYLCASVYNVCTKPRVSADKCPLSFCLNLCVCVGGGEGMEVKNASFFRSLEEKSAIDIYEKMCSCVVDTSSRPCAPDPDFRCVLMLLGGGGGEEEEDWGHRMPVCSLFCDACITFFDGPGNIASLNHGISLSLSPPPPSLSLSQIKPCSQLEPVALHQEMDSMKG